MLNDRQKIDLDNWITGHWGEDQFKDDPENTDFDTLEEQTREDEPETNEETT